MWIHPLQESVGASCIHTGECEQEGLTTQILSCAVLFHFVIRKWSAGLTPGAKASKRIWMAAYAYFKSTQPVPFYLDCIMTIIIVAIMILMLIINRAFSILTVIILKMGRFFSFQISKRNTANKCDPLKRSGMHNLTDVTIFDTEIIDFVVVSLTLMVFGVDSTRVRTTIYAHTKRLRQVRCVIFFWPKLDAKFSLLNIKLNVSKSFLWDSSMIYRNGVAHMPENVDGGLNWQFCGSFASFVKWSITKSSNIYR